ncbi:hypothetical protein LXL04_004962 [Taraxacum kok-saghyz]
MEGDRVRRRSGRVCAQIRPGRQGKAVHVDLDEIEVESAVVRESTNRKIDLRDVPGPSQPHDSKKRKKNIQHDSRKRRTSVCPPTQDDDDDNFVDTPLQQLRTRFPTKRLTDFVSGLNTTQKACINSIRFGSILKQKVDKFSKSLAFWVVDKYNPDTNSICFYNKTIKVTKEQVNEIYGIPMGDEEMKINNESVNIPRPSIAYWTEKLLEDWESKELEMGGYGNTTVTMTDLVASSSKQAKGNDEAVLECNEDESDDVDEETHKLENLLWEIDFNFKELSKAKKNLKKLLEVGAKEYPEDPKVKERLEKNIRLFGEDNESSEKGSDEGGEEVSVPTMTQLLTPVAVDNLLHDAVVRFSGSKSLEREFKTPEMIKKSQHNSKGTNDDIIDVMPLNYVPPTHEKRVSRTTAKAKSLYLKRVIDSGTPLQHVEMQVSGWVFAGMESPWDVIYLNQFNDAGLRGTKQLIPVGSQWDLGGIPDLGPLENPGSYPGPHIPVPIISPICPIIYRYFENDIPVNRPIFQVECVIIDNSGSDVPMAAKYGSVPSDLTKKNKVDCGVFVMRHMKTYKGEHMDKWDARLEIKDGGSQQEQLNELRRKYVTKMLLSDMNLKKDLVVGKLHVYDNIPENIRKHLGQKHTWEGSKQDLKL